MEYNESMLIQRIGEMKLFAETDSSHMTLHCAHCNTVLGDSYGVCGDFSIKHMDSIMCLKVTNDVVISDPMELGRKGDLANCICSSLKCRVCCCDVGKVIHSAPSHLATIRSLFLLYKAKISCYILDSRSMVRASKLKFHTKPLREHINEVRQQVEAQLNQMSHAHSRLTSGTSELNK